MHIPVMVKEVIELLNPQPGGIYVDATVGLGGHAKAILEKIGPNGILIGIDRDKKALELVSKVLERDNVKLVEANFRNITSVLSFLGIEKVDGVLFDLGLSSFQIEDEERGFSFLHNGKLDMRMGSDSKKSAMDLINELSLEELARIFKDYGEERNAYAIAKAIVEKRRKKRIETTLELVSVIRDALPKPLQRRMGKHPARRVFQALRIAVNDELNSLKEGLTGAIEVLKHGGVLCVISYHSLEDRIVKGYFRYLREQGLAELLTKGPLRPTEREIMENPRSRSAKLRAVRRIA